VDIYLDCADSSQWALPAGCPPVVGVTTNPSLVFQAGLSVSLTTYGRLVDAAGAHGMAQLMVQLPSADVAQVQAWVGDLQARAAKAGVQLTIKLPCQPNWLACIQAVQSMQQPVLLTGLSNAVQLLWAQSLGVDFVAPYVGRLAADTVNGGRDVWALMQACVVAQNGPGAIAGPKLLAASIKSPDVLSRLMALGAAAVTLPPASLIAWSQDAITDAAVAQFERDIAASHALA
jgi:transaldolase